MVKRSALFALLLFVLSRPALADDWPQFRGPARDGVSREKGLLKTWPKDGPKLLWTFKDGGLGFSSVVVVGDTVYFTGTRNDKEEVVIALDIDNGKEKWTAPIGPLFTFEGNKWGDGPRGTPTIDGNLLFALGGQGDLVCLDLTRKGKKEVWRKNLSKDFGGQMMTEWGYSESPLVDGDLLICTPGSTKGTLAALDKKTGEVKWRSKELKNLAPYSSVVAADIHGVRQYIVNSYVRGGKTGGGHTSGVAAKNGTLLWTMPIFKLASYAIAPTPIVKDNLVYVTSGHDGVGCHLFEIDKEMKARDLYPKSAQKNFKNSQGGVVLLDGHIYGHSEKTTWKCQDFKTGQIKWADKNNLDGDTGSITAAEGLLYLLSDAGEAVLLKADPTKWGEELGRFTIPQTSAYPKTRPTSQASKVWSYPVIAHGRLFLRDCEFVYCYDISARKK